MMEEIVGWTAASIGIFVAMPQLYKVYKTKSAADLSWGMWISLSLAQALWMTYGILIGDIIVVVPNLIALITNMTIVVLKHRYEKATS